MTVLQESAPLGSSSRGLKTTLAVVAIVVAGVGAGFGLSQRTDQIVATVDAMSVRAPMTAEHIETWQRNGLAQIDEMRAQRLLNQRIETGLIQKAEITEANRPR